MRFDASPSFQNRSATDFLQYCQSPALRVIHGGDYLHQILLQVVEPPIFWNAFLLSFRNRSLGDHAQQCFAWLLHELICLPPQKSVAYRAIAQDDSIQRFLLDSPSLDLRTLGQRIKHVLSTFETPSSGDGEFGPGGRHDNDLIDFREIAIHPTADELLSEEEPFLRLAAAIDDPEAEDKRLINHLDNQFRLLREDMLAEMRDELQIIFGKKKARHRGMVIDGFQAVGVDCGDPMRRRPWGVNFQCTTDLRQHFHCKPKDRKAFLINNRHLFKHQALTCLILDGEIAAFPTIHRDVDQLAKTPPIVTLQFTGRASTTKALLKLKVATKLTLVQIDTAVFAFEPVLKAIQELKELSLADELLFWSPESLMVQPAHAPLALIGQLESRPFQDLKGILKTTKSIQLDDSQARSLLTGLKQRVSLIQGPPGKGYRSMLVSFLS